MKNPGLQFVNPPRHESVAAVAMDNKKSLLQTGIDPMELAFKASLLTRFQGGWDRTRATHFQDECQAHCTSGATICQPRVLSVIRKRDMNKSFISSERGMPTHGSSSILLHTYLLCHRMIWSHTNQKCDCTTIINVVCTVCVRVPSLSRLLLVALSSPLQASLALRCTHSFRSQNLRS